MPFFSLKWQDFLIQDIQGERTFISMQVRKWWLKEALKGLMSTRDPQSELGTFPHQSSILFVDSFEATWQQRNKLCLSNEAAVLANI